MTEVKKTKVEFFREAAAILQEQNQLEHAEFLKSQADQIEASYAKRKDAAKDKVSRVAQENQEYAKQVVDFFNGAAEVEVAYTLGEIADATGLGDLTPQKVSAIMKYVDNAEKVDKASSNKKKIGFKRVNV